MQTDTRDPLTEAQTNDDETGEEKGLGTRSELETFPGCKRRLKAAVPREKVSEELDRNYRELGGTIQLPGFRPGRIPRKLLEARFGEEIENDVKASLLNSSFFEVVEEKSLKVVGQPKFDEVHLKAGDDLTYVVDFEVQPEFELGEYTGLSVAVEKQPITDEEVEERVRLFLKREGQLVPVDSTEAGPDDVFIGQYSLRRDSEEVKKGVEARFTPSSKVLDAFLLEELPAAVAAWDRSTGEPLRVKVKIGPQYPDEVLRGVEADLEFTLSETRRLQVPVLDDELAKKYHKASVEEFRQGIRESLETFRRRKEERAVEEKILDQIIERTPMELPEGLVEGLRGSRRLQREYELLEQGFRPEDVKELLIKEAGAGSEDAQRQAIRREMKEFFILEKIAEKEKIFATEEETDERLDAMAQLYNVPTSALREELRKSGRIEELRHTMRHEKVRELLRSKAQISGAG
jgi:trigger factor